nr:hypothetical protein [Kofleriaceae bacterium]
MDIALNVDPGIAYAAFACIVLVSWLRLKRARVAASSSGGKS